MSDLISRQDAIALVIKAIHGTDNKGIQEYLFDGLRKQMWSLPSADRPIGRWVDNTNGTYTCDRCGCKHSRSNFCPNCGAKMGVEE